MTKIFTAESAENAEILGSKSNPSVTGGGEQILL
jgi:hypothetical protein